MVSGIGIELGICLVRVLASVFHEGAVLCRGGVEAVVVG